MMNKDAINICSTIAVALSVALLVDGVIDGTISDNTAGAVGGAVGIVASLTTPLVTISEKPSVAPRQGRQGGWNETVHDILAAIAWH